MLERTFDPTALDSKRAGYVRAISSYLQRAIDETRNLRPSEEIDVAGLEDKIAGIDRTLGRISRFNNDRDSGEPSMTFTRCARALAVASGNRDAALREATTQNDTEVKRALTASVAASGGFAIPTVYSAEVVDFLRPRVAVRKLGPVVVPMPHGNLTVPRITVGGTAAYQGENPVIAPNQPSFGALSLVARKQAALVPVSNSLLRFSAPAANVIVETDLIAAIAAVEDYAFLRGDGTQFQPKGLVNWALPQNQIPSLGGGYANADADLANLELALISANCRMLRPAFILSPEAEVFLRNTRGSGGERFYPEMNDGLLRGKPYFATTQMTVSGTGKTSQVILADFADVLVGEFPIVISVATAGTYLDGSGATVDAFSQDQTIIRVISQSDLCMRHPQSVAVLNNVTWGQA